MLAAGPTVIGFGLYNVSLSYLPASVVNLIATLEPVFTAAIAYVLLGEILSATQMYGGLLIIVAVLSLRLLGLRTEEQARRGAECRVCKNSNGISGHRRG